MNPLDALTALWSLGGLPPQALAGIALTGSDPVFPSSFAVGTAAQTSIAAAALAACELGHERGACKGDGTDECRKNMAHSDSVKQGSIGRF